VVPITTQNWETITDAMAETMDPGPFNTGFASHLEGIDFAGKTGTAQLVNHSVRGDNLLTGNARANAWFVGMAPRRNPDIVVAVLAEHGGWGATASAPYGAQVINAFVTKQRRLAGNLRLASLPKSGEGPAPKASASPTASATQNPNGVPTASANPVSKPGAASTSPVKP